MSLPFKTETLPYIKTLSGAPASLFFALLAATRPVGRNELAIVVDYGKDKVAEGLKILEALGIAQNIKRYQGWMLTKHGRQLAMPLDPLEAPEVGRSTQSTSLPITTTVNSLGDEDSKIIDSHTYIDSNTTVEATGKSTQSTSQEEIKKIVSELIADDESKSDLLDALRSAGIAMNSRTINLLQSDGLTAEIVKSQHQALIEKGKGSQTGILISILENPFIPKGAEFDPDTGHPTSCDCYKCFGARNRRYLEDNQIADDEPEEEPPQQIIEPDPSVDEIIHGSFSAALAWQATLGQLQLEMSKAAFDTWVSDAQVIKFENDIFTIAVPNAYARDWLEDRLTKTINKLLTGILNRQIQVFFVTPNQNAHSSRQS